MDRKSNRIAGAIKRWLTVVLLFCVMFTAEGQHFPKVLKRGEVLKVTHPHLIVMDESTFAEYFFYRLQFDSLSGQVKRYDQLITEKDSLFLEKEVQLHLLLEEKGNQIREQQTAYQQLQVLAASEIKENMNLQHEVHKENKRKLFWQTASLILAGVSLIAIAL